MNPAGPRVLAVNGGSSSIKFALFEAGDPPKRVLGGQVQWIAELAERTVESAHDRARIDTRLARAREALEAEPVLCTGVKKAS